MNVQYNRQYNDDDIIEDGVYYCDSRELSTRPHSLPKSIGIAQIVSGFISALLGTMEVFIVPMAESTSGANVILLNKQNCYGAGFIAGILMVLTGSTAIRASISKRNTTVARFYNLTILTFILYVAVTIFLISAYSFGWTTADKYPPNSRVRQVHLFVTVNTVLGLMFVLTALVKYYDIVFSKSVNLIQRWRSYLCCCCPKNADTQSTQPNQLM